MKQLNIKQDVVPFLIATIGEFIALYFWLTYMDRDELVVANVLLWIGFIIERVSVVVWIRKVHNPQAGLVNMPMAKQIIGIALITFSEILVWMAWLWVANAYGHLAGFVVLMILMLLEHSMEMALIKHESIWYYIKDLRVNLFTFIEVIGGVGWLYFHQQEQDILAIATLLLGLSIEHLLQGGELKVDQVEKQRLQERVS